MHLPLHHCCVTSQQPLRLVAIMLPPSMLPPQLVAERMRPGVLRALCQPQTWAEEDVHVLRGDAHSAWVGGRSACREGGWWHVMHLNVYV